MLKNKKLLILLFIGLIAIGTRFYRITFADTYTDETINAFRSIGMIDYDTSPSQTTPWQWFASVPWWGHLSFHDHPLGWMWLVHASFSVFGVNLFAIRFPAVVVGLGSIILVYLISKKLFTKNETAYFAAMLMAVQSYMVWVSRVGLQDGLVIFLLLLDVFVLLHVKEKPRYWWLLGLTCGLGIITKYTTLIIFPIIMVYCFVNRVSFVKNKKYIGASALVCFLAATPVWLYNAMLYRATGHFDFQFSAALGQDVPQWTYRMGRVAVGGLGDRFKNFFVAMSSASSIIFCFGSIAAVGVAFWQWLSKRETKLSFIGGAIGLMYLWFFVIGSTYRFVVMIVPLLILLFAYEYDRISQIGKARTIVILNLAVGVWFVLEFLFTINSFLLPRSFGFVNRTYAKINDETQNYGFNQLNLYIENILQGRVSALFGQPAYQFLTDTQNKRIKAAKDSDAKPLAIVMVYNHDINFMAGLWLFQRRLVYDGWPVMDNLSFGRLTKGKFDSYYRSQGINEFVYIVPISEDVKRPIGDQSGSVDDLENYLKSKNIVPEVVTNAQGKTAFLVYRF
ncbi:MAG: glycosyltransferase family 39 protein [Candidatus Magasanikbacteria bacterium]|nr:glycosyltransferase family 39 protein [Candidatus Magasanikbacteria bacterium]